MIQPIGILDSGVGGLTVTKEIIKLLPFEDIIYFGDTLHFPYGDKSVEEIRSLTSRLVKYFIGRNVKLIVLACNTATVSSIEYLRSIYNVPLVGVVPVVKTAANLTKNNILGVIATKFTIESRYHADLINKFANGKQVINQACPQIVELIEDDFEKNLPEIERLLGKYLTPLISQGIDVLALGCTHYPIVKDLIQKAVGFNIHVLDSGEAVANQVKRVLNNNKQLNEKRKPVYKFYCSGPSDSFNKILKHVIEIGKIEVERINI